MQESMKALVYEGPRELNTRHQDRPVPKEGEVRIKVECVGICGSELSGYLGKNSLRKPPLVMGHEFSGTIDVVQGGNDTFKLGDRVTANPLISCGICRDCQAGAANLCASRQLIGAHRPGAFAEYVCVPFQNVYKLEDHVSYADGAMVEPFACAVRLGRIVKLTAYDRLLIVGAGPIGLFAMQAAQVQGVKNIVVMDINKERLEIVEELGGIGVHSEEQLKTHVPGRGFDVAMDAVGMDVTRQTCMNYAAPGGRVAFSGLHAADSTLPINLAIRNELSLYGSFGYNPIDFEIALEWITAELVDIKPWSKWVSLEEGKESFELLLGNPGKLSKILIEL